MARHLRITISRNIPGFSAAAASATVWLRRPVLSSRTFPEPEVFRSQSTIVISCAASRPSGRSPTAASIWV